jgi:hypothetical protein
MTNMRCYSEISKLIWKWWFVKGYKTERPAIKRGVLFYLGIVLLIIYLPLDFFLLKPDSYRTSLESLLEAIIQ